MRPLRCSMRPGFQGRSKWKRSAQWAWKLRPSRAASVAMQDAQRVLGRVGVERGAGSPCARSPLVRPSMTAMRSSARSVPSIACSRIWLQVALRALAVLGEDQDAAVVPLRRLRRRTCSPNGGRSGQRLLADPVDQPADLRVGPVAGALGDLLHLVEQAPARAPRQRRRRAHRSQRRPSPASIACGLLGLELLVGPLAALVVGAGRARSSSSAGGGSAVAACAPACSHWRSTVAR